MKVKPIKTRVLNPPQDDLFTVFDESLSQLQEKDVLVVTSKVVAIHQGRCIPIGEVDKEELIEKEADWYLKTTEGPKPRLTIKYHTFVSASGIDESNGNGYYVLLPDDPYQASYDIWRYIRRRYNLNKLGVIITDSYSLAFRYGAMSISIGYHGFNPLRHYEGKKDLFGRKFVYERNNLVDALSAVSALVMGEGKECVPLAIVRDIPDISFTNTDTKNDFLIPPREDIYWPLLKKFYE